MTEANNLPCFLSVAGLKALFVASATLLLAENHPGNCLIELRVRRSGSSALRALLALHLATLFFLPSRFFILLYHQTPSTCPSSRWNYPDYDDRRDDHDNQAEIAASPSYSAPRG